MANLAKQMVDLSRMDTLSRQAGPIHQLDPRAKLLVTLFFCAVAVSFDRHSVARLLPLLLFPAVLCGVGRIPVLYILKKIVWVSPFALMVAIMSPLLETRPVLTLGEYVVTAGQLSFLSILLRFALTVGATLCLLAVTGFYPLLQAAERLGAPKVLVVQLMFFFRYIFVLFEETGRMLRARSLRAFGVGLGLASFGPLTGRLLLRTLDRAERIHRAMSARGFTGEIRLCRPLRFRFADGVFIVSWLSFFALVRCVDVTSAVGRFVMGQL